jgi:hypothetical protein
MDNLVAILLLINVVLLLVIFISMKSMKIELRSLLVGELKKSEHRIIKEIRSNSGSSSMLPHITLE